MYIQRYMYIYIYIHVSMLCIYILRDMELQEKKSRKRLKHTGNLFRKNLQFFNRRFVLNRFPVRFYLFLLLFLVTPF